MIRVLPSSGYVRHCNPRGGACRQHAWHRDIDQVEDEYENNEILGFFPHQSLLALTNSLEGVVTRTHVFLPQ